MKKSNIPTLQWFPLDHLLHNSDVVTLHVALSDRTQGFVGNREFACMKPGSWFINTGRGELVDERALLDALQKRHLGARRWMFYVMSTHRVCATTQSFAMRSSIANLLITPHIGGCNERVERKNGVFSRGKGC